MTKRIWCDLDGVLCDLTGGLAKQIGFNPSDVKNWDCSPAVENQDKMFGLFRAPGFWPLLCKPYEGMVDFIVPLANACDDNLVILSNISSPQEAAGKVEWVGKYLRGCESRLCLSLDKTRIFRPGDVVIDDSPAVLNYARKVGAVPICISRPWNQPTSKPAWDGPRFDYRSAPGAVEAALEGRYQGDC